MLFYHAVLFYFTDFFFMHAPTASPTNITIGMPTSMLMTLGTFTEMNHHCGWRNELANPLFINHIKNKPFSYTNVMRVYRTL